MDLPKPGPPCIFFNDAQRKCIVCSPGWLLSNGRCLRKSDCPPDQYILLGTCYDVIANCAEFQFYGGLCTLCKSGFNLVDLGSGLKECREVVPTCIAGEYLLEKVCKKYVPFCSDFDTLTAICSACETGYQLNNNACDSIAQTVNPCPPGQEMRGTSCQVVQNCVYADPASGWCAICIDGYQSRGVCVRITCKDR